MAEQIIKQPDGRLAVFSTITDSLIVLDASPEEIVEWRSKRAAANERARTRQELDRLLDENDPGPYYQFAMTWAQVVAKGRGSGPTNA